MAANGSSGGEKNYIACSSLCVFVITIIIMSSSIRISFVVLLSCLYLNPWVSPFVGLSSPSRWRGRGGGSERLSGAQLLTARLNRSRWAVRGACCYICRVFKYSETTVGREDVHAASTTPGLASSRCHGWGVELRSPRGPLGPRPAQSDPVAGHHCWRGLSERAKESYLEVVSVPSEQCPKPKSSREY